MSTASTYKEYRPRTRTMARTLTDDIRVLTGVEDGQPQYENFKAGDYEIRNDDGSLTYKAKADFDAANEPVRREREKKTAGKTAGGSKKSRAATPTSTTT